MYEYNLDGTTKSVTYENGAKVEYVYNADKTLQKLTNTYGEVVEEYYYTYDNNKNIIRKTEKGKLFAYTYDALNRIKTISEITITPNEEGIEEETPILLTTYSYDNVGNRTKEVSGNIVKDYVYNYKNQLTKITEKENNIVTKTTTYTYDNNGNINISTKKIPMGMVYNLDGTLSGSSVAIPSLSIVDTAALNASLIEGTVLISTSGMNSNGYNKKDDNKSITHKKLEDIKNLDDIIDDPEILKNTTPDGLYNYLKENGYEVKPLGGGDLAGIEYLDGGGYRINWGGDRILQYHPEGGRHHGGLEYYKLSSGKTGTLRYDRYGQLLPQKYQK